MPNETEADSAIHGAHVWILITVMILLYPERRISSLAERDNPLAKHVIDWLAFTTLLAIEPVSIMPKPEKQKGQFLNDFGEPPPVTRHNRTLQKISVKSHPQQGPNHEFILHVFL